MDNILIITHNFFWRSGSGTLRVIKFAKYLPRFEIKPIFLTINPDSGLSPFESEELPKNVCLYSTSFIDPIFFHKKRKNKYNAKLLKNIKENGVQEISNRLYQHSIIKNIIEIKNRIKDSLLLHDEKLGWLPFALIKGVHVIKKNNIKAIYATTPPSVTLYIGYLLKKFTGIPLVLEFRDPWTTNPFKQKKLKLIKFLEKRLEKIFLKSSDLIITVTDEIKKDLINRYNFLAPKKVITITNGFDPDDFSFNEDALEEFRRKDKFVITYTGNFYRKRTPEFFLKEIEKLININPKLKKDLLIRFVGETGRKCMDLRNKMRKMEILTETGYVPHRTSLKYLLSSDLLLLIRFSGKGSHLQIPGKLYEYLGTGKPIIALIPLEGAIPHIIKSTNSGWVVEPEDSDSFQKLFQKLYKIWKNNNLSASINRKNIEEYKYRILIKRLSTILKAEIIK